MTDENDERAIEQLRQIFGERVAKPAGPPVDAVVDEVVDDGVDTRFAEKLMKQGNREDKYR